MINLLGGKAMFEVGSGIFSKTKSTSYKTIKMNDDNENSCIKEKKLTLIDVPGFTDNLEENIDITNDILNITLNNLKYSRFNFKLLVFIKLPHKLISNNFFNPINVLT